MIQPRTRWHLHLVCVILASACQAPPPPATFGEARTAERHDSAGIEIVENWGPLDTVIGSWAVDTASRVEIANSEEGSREYFIRGTQDVGRLSDGSIVVLSLEDAQVLVFDSVGTFLRKFGRHGEGPGEFAQPQALQVLAGDTIVVWDYAFMGRTYLDATGKVLDTRKINYDLVSPVLGPDRYSAEQLLPAGNGAFVVKALIKGYTPPEGEFARPPLDYLLIPTNYQGKTLGRFGGSGVMRQRQGKSIVVRRPMFAVNSYVAASDTGSQVYVSNGDSDDIQVFNGVGALVRIIRRHGTTRPIAESDISKIRESIERVRKNFPQLTAEAVTLASTPIPGETTITDVTQLLVDREGYLWSRNQWSGWSVFDPSGAWVATVVLPGMEVSDIGKDHVLGRSMRKAGAEDRVLVYRLRRGW